ncbi:MAG: metallopeptidase family protein [Kiritimatiellaeota bacterium]|nr:metallopeptidase family protein [Kiritimatiellota bacterium]
MSHKKRWFDLADAEASALLAALPAPLRERLSGVSVTLAPYPTASDITEDGDEEDLLGLFIGAALGEEIADGEPSPEIRLFIENILHETDGNETAFRREVRTTLLHEIGHYLGLDEDSLELRGLA